MYNEPTVCDESSAMTRILRLDLSHTPGGKLMALVEYMGYARGELIPVERLIDPANALTDAFKAVQMPEADAHRTVHYVITEMKRGETDIPSLMHHGNHTELISLAALQRRGYCRESCTVFRLMPNVPFFLSLALADIMTDCEGKSLEHMIPPQTPPGPGTNTRRRASLSEAHHRASDNGHGRSPILSSGTGGRHRGGWQMELEGTIAHQRNQVQRSQAGLGGLQHGIPYTDRSSGENCCSGMRRG